MHPSRVLARASSRARRRRRRRPRRARPRASDERASLDARARRRVNE